MQLHLSRRTRKPGANIAISLALFVLTTPLASRGFFIGDIIPIPLPFPTLEINCVEGIEVWRLKIDPQNVESFQLDIQFDPSLADFLDLNYVSPYVQTTSPDLSMLGSGLLQDVAGTSSIFPPPPGDVDLFIVDFADLNLGLPVKDAKFTVFASSNDYIVGVDPATGVRTVYSSLDISSLSLSVPFGRLCPDSSSAIVDLGVLSAIALSARLRRMRVH